MLVPVNNVMIENNLVNREICILLIAKGRRPMKFEQVCVKFGSAISKKTIPVSNCLNHYVTVGRHHVGKADLRKTGIPCAIPVPHITCLCFFCFAAPDEYTYTLTVFNI